MIKAVKKLGIEGMFLNTIKAIHDKLRANITKWRTTETVPLKVRNKTGLSVFSTPIQYSLGILSQSSKSRAINKRDSNREVRSQTIPIYK
jgi:hypothetical protein